MQVKTLYAIILIDDVGKESIFAATIPPMGMQMQAVSQNLDVIKNAVNLIPKNHKYKIIKFEASEIVHTRA